MTSLVSKAFPELRERAADIARASAAQMLSDLSTSKASAVNKEVAESILRGETSDQLADRLYFLVGMGPREIQASRNYRQGLLDQGMAWPMAQEMTKGYQQRARTARVRRIARTEVRKALATAQRAQWAQEQQIGALPTDATRQVVPHSGMCGVCVEEADQHRPLNDPLGPPFHPNCGCEEVVVSQATVVAKVRPLSSFGRARDGDGDGFVYDGTPRQRLSTMPSARQWAPSKWMVWVRPEHRAEFKAKYQKTLPKNWDLLQVNMDNTHPSGLVAKGKVNGKWKYIYTAEKEGEQDAVKYKRVEHLAAAAGKVENALASPQDSTEACLRLMWVTAMRVGSTDKQIGKQKAYGATTLRAKHVSFEGEGVVLDFIAKEGIHARYPITDSSLVGYLRNRLDGNEDPEARLFDTDAKQTMTRLKEVSGLPWIINHDIRTLVANMEALKALSTMSRAKNRREFLKMRAEVGRIVAERLRNQPAQALGSYINPTVFHLIEPEGQDD